MLVDVSFCKEVRIKFWNLSESGSDLCWRRSVLSEPVVLYAFLIHCFTVVCTIHLEELNCTAGNIWFNDLDIVCTVSRPKKLLYSSTDENFKPAVHELYDSSRQMEKVCRYDLDELDSMWLAQYNRLRQLTGLYIIYCIIILLYYIMLYYMFLTECFFSGKFNEYFVSISCVTVV